ncbi:hypothetical protein ACFLUV_02300 [Elusimicrobiota bacterium]
MNKKNIWSFLAITGILLFSVCAPQIHAGDEELIQELLDKSGATKQITMLPQVIMTMLPSQLAIHNADTEASSTVNAKISTEYFVAENILNSVKEQLKKDFNKSYAEKYIKWLDTELGKKITQMEIDASSPEAAMSIMAYMIQLQQESPSEERIALVNKLAEVLKAAEQYEERSADIMIKIARGINKKLPKNRKTPDSQLDEIKEVYKKASVSQIGSYLIPTFLYTYQSLPDGDLKKYIDFLSTEEGVWFNQILFTTQLTAIEEDCDKYGQDLGTELAKLKPVKKEKLKWKKYKEPEGSFALEFPGKVQTQTIDIPIENGTIYMNIFSIELNNMAFMVSSIKDYPPLMQEDLDVEAILFNAANGSAANTGGTIIEAEYISMDDYPGLDFLVSVMSGSGLIRSQIFLADGSFYQLMITGSLRDVIQKENERFLNSFKIISK